MTRPPLRLVQPGELHGPLLDEFSASVVTEAAGSLAALRTPYWLGDSAVSLHALASLIAPAQQMIPEAVSQARDQGRTLARDRLAAQPVPAGRRPPIPLSQRVRLVRTTLRNASDRPQPEGFECACCGRYLVTAVEGLFRNPQRGSPARFCSPACRQAAWRRRQARVPEDAPAQLEGGRRRQLRNNSPDEHPSGI